MSFAQFIALLRARWIVALCVFALVAGGTLLVSLLLPKSYTATSSVVLDVKPDPLGTLINASGLTPGMIETQIDIIQSDRVAMRVVKNLKLTDNPQARQQWQDQSQGVGDFDLWMAETLQRNLDARPSRASGVISIGYRSPDPKFAAALANAFAQAYLQVALELRVDPARQYGSFFDTRTTEAREALEKAQAKASAYLRDNNIISIDERFDVETARLNELSTQLVALQAMSAEGAIRQAQAQLGGGWTSAEATVHLYAPALGLGLATLLAMPGQLGLAMLAEGQAFAGLHAGLLLAPLGIAAVVRVAAPRVYAPGFFEAVAWLAEATRSLAGPPEPPARPVWVGRLQSPVTRLLVTQWLRLTAVPLLRLALLLGWAAYLLMRQAPPSGPTIAVGLGLAALWVTPLQTLARLRRRNAGLFAGLPLAVRSGGSPGLTLVIAGVPVALAARLARAPAPVPQRRARPRHRSRRKRRSTIRRRRWHRSRSGPATS